MNTKELIALYKSVQVSSNMLIDSIRKSDASWQCLAENGLKFEAAKKYREENKCNVREAVDTVEAHITEYKVQLLSQMSKEYQEEYFSQASK